MPVSNRQYEDGRRAVKQRMDEANNLEGLETLYRAWMAVTPKGYRASLLKFIDWPTSWAVLYDLSPAQISQNRESVLAMNAWTSTSNPSSAPVSNTRKILAWRRLLRAYFAGNPDPMSQQSFPRWRKPSWMTPAEAEQIKELISSAYEGNMEASMTLTDQTDFNQLLGDSSEGEAATEEAQAPQVDDSSGNAPRRVVGRQLSDALFSLYGNYWRQSHDVRSEETLYGAIVAESSPGDGNSRVKRAAEVILTLEALGYEYRGIEAFTTVIGSKKMQLFGTRPGTNSGYGAYLLVDLKGANDGARRYRSRMSYAIMSAASRVPDNRLEAQFSRPAGTVSRSELQTFRFTGRGYTLGGFQVLSLNFINGQENTLDLTEGRQKLADAYRRAVSRFNSIRNPEQVDSASTTAADERQAATAQAASELASEGTLQSGSGGQGDTDVDVSVSSPNYYYLGYARFPARRAFSTISPLYYETEGLYRVDGSQQSFAFYFVRPNRGAYEIYRSIFSPMVVNTASDLNTLKRAWVASGQLDSASSIKLKKASPQEAQRVKQAFLEVGVRTNSGPSRTEIKPERIVTDAISVPFNKIGSSLLVLQQLTSQFEAGTGTSTSSTSSNMILTKQQMISSARVKFENHTIGWELEAYVKQSTRSRAASELNRVAPDGALKFKSGDPTTMPVNGGTYGMVPDGSIRAANSTRGRENREDEGYEGYTVAEFVSPVLEGQKGLDLIKKCCEAMNAAGVRVNSSDGLHVHFDGHGRGSSPKLEAWQMSNLVINYHVLWPVIAKYQNLGRASRQSGWAADFSDEKIEQFKAFSDAKSTNYKKLYVNIYGGYRISGPWAVGAGPKYHDSRYRAVNLHGTVTQAGTIEFRQGSPTTDYLYIQNWILFLYHLIEVSKKGYFEKPDGDMESSAYIQKAWKYCELMLPDDVASFIANETYMIDGETVEYGMPSPRRTR